MVAPLPELGRFAEPALYILVSLSEGPKHGYAIMTESGWGGLILSKARIRGTTRAAGTF